MPELPLADPWQQPLVGRALPAVTHAERAPHLDTDQKSTMRFRPHAKILAAGLGVALAPIGSLPARADSAVGFDAELASATTLGLARGWGIALDPDEEPKRSPNGILYSRTPRPPEPRARTRRRLGGERRRRGRRLVVVGRHVGLLLPALQGRRQRRLCPLFRPHRRAGSHSELPRDLRRPGRPHRPVLQPRVRPLQRVASQRVLRRDPEHLLDDVPITVERDRLGQRHAGPRLLPAARRHRSTRRRTSARRSRRPPTRRSDSSARPAACASIGISARTGSSSRVTRTRIARARARSAWYSAAATAAAASTSPKRSTTKRTTFSRDCSTTIRRRASICNCRRRCSATASTQ